MYSTQARPITYLRLSVTDLCNFKCHYCLPNGYQKKKLENKVQKELALQDISILASVTAKLGVRKIRLTGGEPSLRADLPDIINLCKNTPGIEYVAVTTNGYKLPHNIQSWVEAGLDQLTVSIDAFNRADFKSATGYDGFNQLIQGIQNAHEFNLKVKINTVVYNNSLDLNSIFAFLEQNAVSIRLIELMETQKNSALLAREKTDIALLESNMQKMHWSLIEPGLSDGPARTYMHKNFKGTIGFITPYSQNFCNTCNRIRISADGHLYLCLFDKHKYNLMPFLSDKNQLLHHLREVLLQKPLQHRLAQNETGLIQNFSMIGG